MKNNWLIPTILSGIVLLGLMVVICGIALCMGFKTISLIGFLGALVVLALLRIIGWLNSTPR